MAVAAKSASARAVGGELQKIEALLGRSRTLARHLTHALDAHELLLQGLPTSALDHLVGNLVVISKNDSLEKAFGMSLRTWQRRRDTPSKPLSQEQSGRAWKFAEILTKATGIFGSQAEAEQWLERPTVGLDQRRPIDLLATPVGIELVEDHLDRLEYGVYA